LYEPDSVNSTDGMATANAPWRHTTTNYAFDEREVMMNRTPARLVDLVKTKRVMSMGSLAKKMEINMWGKPTDSSDVKTPFGIKYWVVTNSTEGFNGGNPSGFSGGAGGLSSSTYSNWANWTANYTSVSETDLIRKWRKAATYTEFMPPVDVPQYNTGNQYGFYTNYDVIYLLEEALKDQNESLGMDIASTDGRTLFRKTPVVWVPYLDDDSTDPVYGINWGVFKPVFLQGMYLKEKAPRQAPNQHNVYEVFVDLTYNFICYDRRQLFVLYK